MRGKVLLAGLVAVGVLGAGWAYAAIPDSSGVIHGCYDKKSGALRIVDSASQCLKNETAIQWPSQSAQGPTGPTGATGASGPSGPQGQTGATGPTGPSGVSGINGTNGGTGPSGPTGATGPTGPSGSGGGLASLEGLNGLPCEGDGTVQVIVDQVTHVVTTICLHDQFVLTVSTSGSSTASITSDVGGINCGNGHGVCSAVFDSGTVVTLTELHDIQNFHFDGWGGACSGTAGCQVTMDQNRTVSTSYHSIALFTVNLQTQATAITRNCNIFFCSPYFGEFTDAKARVTVTDVDASQVLAACDASTTMTVQVGFDPTVPLPIGTTQCLVEVPIGHHISIQAEDSTTLGGNQVFVKYFNGPCDTIVSKVCAPGGAVSVPDSTSILNQNAS
jgi:hypothetical protein